MAALRLSLLDGRDLRSMRLADVRRLVVVVAQQPFMFNASLRENIRYARPDANEDQVSEAAMRAGLGPFIARSAQGLGTEVGEGARALSAGERQRVAIARALLASPSVLVLDEATGSLDPATEAEVASGYEELMRGRTTIVITHRPELARRTGRIVTLERGAIVVITTPNPVGADDAGVRQDRDERISISWELTGTKAVSPARPERYRL